MNVNIIAIAQRLVRFCGHAVVLIATTRNVTEKVESIIARTVVARRLFGDHHLATMTLLTIATVLVIDIIGGGHDVHQLVRDLIALWKVTR
jgi:hypothetical protein